MKYFDLHCDTLYRIITEGKNILQSDCAVSIKKSRSHFSAWCQALAIWIPDDISHTKSLELFKKAHNVFSEITQLTSQDSNLNFFFTVEGGSILAGELDILDLLAKCNVRILTLTWNGKCKIGDGVMVNNPKGLTNFGRECLDKMNKLGIVIDISHASLPLFWDVINYSNTPVIATHSNSKAVCNHPRNLSDAQFSAIKDSGGIVGVTFADTFLRDGGHSSMIDIVQHVEHFLGLGGENTVAIGSDFDGTDLPHDMLGIESIDALYNLFLRRNFNESLLNDIFYNNAYRFLFSTGHYKCSAKQSLSNAPLAP